METVFVVVIVIVVVVAVGVAAVVPYRWRRSAQLRQRFEREYERAIEKPDDRREAETCGTGRSAVPRSRSRR